MLSRLVKCGADVSGASTFPKVLNVTVVKFYDDWNAWGVPAAPSLREIAREIARSLWPCMASYKTTALPIELGRREFASDSRALCSGWRES